MDLWIRPWTLNRESAGSGNSVFALSLGKDLNILVPWLLVNKQIAYVVAKQN